MEKMWKAKERGKLRKWGANSGVALAQGGSGGNYGGREMLRGTAQVMPLWSHYLLANVIYSPKTYLNSATYL